MQEIERIIQRKKSQEVSTVLVLQSALMKKQPCFTSSTGDVTHCLLYTIQFYAMYNRCQFLV